MEIFLLLTSIYISFQKTGMLCKVYIEKKGIILSHKPHVWDNISTVKTRTLLESIVSEHRLLLTPQMKAKTIIKIKG